jgi:hypothetical protein
MKITTKPDAAIARTPSDALAIQTHAGIIGAYAG